jgi:hypothetical protein
MNTALKQQAEQMVCVMSAYPPKATSIAFFGSPLWVKSTQVQSTNDVR